MASVNMPRGLRNERGAELIEFALIFPLLLLVLLGIIDFGFLFQRYEVITNAAREGARMAVLPNYTEADVQGRVCSYLEAGGVPFAGCPTSVAVVDVEDFAIPLSGGGTMSGKRVTIAYAHNFMFIGPIVGLMGGSWTNAKTLNVEAIMRTEIQAAAPPTP